MPGLGKLTDPSEIPGEPPRGGERDGEVVEPAHERAAELPKLPTGAPPAPRLPSE